MLTGKGNKTAALGAWSHVNLAGISNKTDVFAAFSHHPLAKHNGPYKVIEIEEVFYTDF